jgi:hypothetical protein
MDALVQFLRNAMCCIKDLGLLQSTFLWDSKHTRHYYDLPHPHDRTTPLEVLISLSQIYALISTSRSGWKLMMQSYGKYQRITRLMDLNNNNNSNSNNSNQQEALKQKDSNATETLEKSKANQLVQESLMKEGNSALRSLFIGFNVFCIGLCFFWLAGNSWHLTEAGIIGGLPALIHALTVMEICLLPILWCMLRDGGAQLSKSRRMQDLATSLLNKSSKALSLEQVELETFEHVTEWVPEWNEGQSPRELNDASKEANLLQNEKSNVQKMLHELFSQQDSDEKEGKLQQARLRERAEALQTHSHVTRYEGYREYVYLLLNAIAFYGYLMSIIVYYFEDEMKQPLSVRRMLLHFDNPSADWHGNFAGDFAWTIEPLIIMTTPFVFQRLRSQMKKPSKIKSE